jgi:hypothetical protein
VIEGVMIIAMVAVAWQVALRHPLTAPEQV